MITNLNKHFTSFLKDNGDDEIVDRWTDEDNQTSFIKIMGGFFDKKAKKDARKSAGPKKGKTAYIYYCMSQRPILTAEYPDLDNKQITAKLGEMWNEIKNDGDQVKEYRELSDQDKARYTREVSEFEESEDNVDEDGKKKKHKTKKVSNGLKKNKSAYLYFCDDERKKIKDEGLDLKSKEVVSEMGKRWSVVKSKNGEQFRKYERMAKADHERYESEKAALGEGGNTTVTEHEVVDEDEQPDEQPVVEKKKVTKKAKATTPPVSENKKPAAEKKKVAPVAEKKKSTPAAGKKPVAEKKKIIRKPKVEIEDEEILEEDDD